MSLNVEGPAYRAHLDSLIIDTVQRELAEGPDAKTEIPCPACKGGADGMLTIDRVIEWRVYPNFVVRVDCDGCGFSQEVTA